MGGGGVLCKSWGGGCGSVARGCFGARITQNVGARAAQGVSARLARECQACTGTRVQGGGEQRTLSHSPVRVQGFAHRVQMGLGGELQQAPCTRVCEASPVTPPRPRAHWEAGSDANTCGAPGARWDTGPHAKGPGCSWGTTGHGASRQSRGTLGHGLSRQPARAPGPAPVAGRRWGAQDLARGLVGLGGVHESVQARAHARPCTGA